MITKTKEIYICEFCRRIYQIKSYAIKHEDQCRKNPKNKQICLDVCNNLIKKTVQQHWDSYDGEHSSTRDIFYCTAKNIYIHPYWVDGYTQENINDGDIENEVMPKECKHFVTHRI